MGAMDFSKATIGVNTSTIREYLESIKSDVIGEAKKALETEQDALFQTFKENWHGQSEENFEANMKAATKTVQNSLDTHYKNLEAKVYAIHNAWIAQDAEMVTKEN